MTGVPCLCHIRLRLQSDQEITLDEVTTNTDVGAARTTDMVAKLRTLTHYKKRGPYLNDLPTETMLQQMQRLEYYKESQLDYRQSLRQRIEE